MILLTNVISINLIKKRILWLHWRFIWKIQDNLLMSRFLMQSYLQRHFFLYNIYWFQGLESYIFGWPLFSLLHLTRINERKHYHFLSELGLWVCEPADTLPASGEYLPENGTSGTQREMVPWWHLYRVQLDPQLSQPLGYKSFNPVNFLFLKLGFFFFFV